MNTMNSISERELQVHKYICCSAVAFGLQHELHISVGLNEEEKNRRLKTSSFDLLI